LDIRASIPCKDGVISIILASALFSAAQATAEPEMSAPEKIDKLYLHVRMGGFVKPDANSQMENQKGQAALAVGAGWRASRHFAAEIEFFGDHQVYSF